MAGRVGTPLSPGALTFLAPRVSAGRASLVPGVAAAVLAELEALHRLLMARHLEREVEVAARAPGDAAVPRATERTLRSAADQR